MRSTQTFNAAVGAALLGFDHEAVVYCRSISDVDANEYAMDYARMLRGRAKGMDPEKRTPTRLFEVNRKVIRARLDNLYSKYFPT